MSPLACSLLALTALLAVATAVSDPDPFCSEIRIGNQTKFTVKMDPEDRRVGFFNIPDLCSLPGRSLVGELILVCDTKKISVPKIHTIDSAENTLSRVYIDCPHRFQPCDILSVTVTQYCQILY